MATDYSIMLLSPHIPAAPGGSFKRSSSSNSSESSSSSRDDSESVKHDVSENPLHIRSPSSPNAARCLEYGKCVESCAAYGRICPLAALAAGHAASLKMDSIVADSAIFDGSPPKFPRTVRAEDLILGDKLGEGGFCFVYACAFKEAPLDESCAVKYLRPQIACQKKTFEHGAADLATEAFFLTKLDHPSIIKLRAVAAGSVESNVCSGKETGFFLVVDRLVETLDQRLQRWKDQMFEIPHTLFYRMSKEYKDKQKEFLKERLKVAVDIASVMSYLQSLNVAYRDLKPDNVGFDREGNLKLFDFGLCKEEKPTIASTEGRYCMTGHTGSRRYMAPEVARNRPYDKSVDAYSFGVLLWEICCLEKPFHGYCSKKHMTNVVIGGERPKMDHSHTSFLPMCVQSLIKACWSGNPDERPTFEDILLQLNAAMEELSIMHPERSRALSMGSHEERSRRSPTSPGKKTKPLHGLGSLRVRSLGLKRSHS